MTDNNFFSHRKQKRFKVQPHFLSFTPEKGMKWLPSVAIWAGAAGLGAILFASQVPKIKETFLHPIVFLGDHFRDKTPDEDKWL